MSDLQNKILDAALPTILFDGWTTGTLERAAKSVGLSAFDVKRAFPAGVIDAIRHFSARADAEMVESLRSQYSLSTMKIRERIASAVMVRLRAHAHAREAVRRALAVFAMPWHAATGLQCLYATVDAMWREAGDTSTDYNFYTKRMLLSKVYTSTLMVWLEDTTEDLSETEAFLRRRIENVMQIEKFKAKAKEQFSSLSAWLPKMGKFSV